MEEPSYLTCLRDDDQLPFEIDATTLDAMWRSDFAAYAERLSKVENEQFVPYDHVLFIRDKMKSALFEGGGRFIVDLPPRHSKTFTLNKWLPTWYLDTFPGRNVMTCSYNEKLATGNGRFVRDVIRHNPSSEVSVRPDASSVTDWQTVGGSEFLSTGISGTMTGRGYHLGIIDDPIKNWREATNARLLIQHREWFASTFLTRAEPGATIIVIATRWSDEDLSGWLLRQGGWTHIHLPALAEEGDQMGRLPGEALCPERYTRDDLLKVREAMESEKIWRALFQADPMPESGEIFDSDTFDAQTWITGELPVFDELVQSWDFSFGSKAKTASWVVGQCWGVKNRDFGRRDLYLIHQIRGKFKLPACIVAMQQMSALYPQARRKFVEEKANGFAVIQTLNGHIPGLIAVNPDKWGSKEARARAAALYFDAGNVYVPHSTIAPWVREYRKELIKFPDYPTDDQVDATTQIILSMEPEISGQGSSVWDLYK